MKHKMEADVNEKTVANNAWKPGQSGNPKGRPPGSRNKFGQDFIDAFADDFAAHGRMAIERVRKDFPVAYLRVAASLVPKKLEISTASNGGALIEAIEDLDAITENRVRGAAGLLNQ